LRKLEEQQELVILLVQEQRELGKERRRMACTDTAKDVNNALHQCGDAAAKIITLQYAAYMN